MDDRDCSAESLVVFDGCGIVKLIDPDLDLGEDCDAVHDAVISLVLALFVRLSEDVVE